MKSTAAIRTLFELSFGCALAFLAVGCATTPPEPLRNPPDIRLGPVLNLVNAGSSTQDRLRLISNSTEQVHVFIASDKLKQLLHITVGPEGVIAQQVVRSKGSPFTIDATFDEQGQLHVLTDSEHFVLEGNEWQASTDTVWQDAGVTIERAGFVHGAKHLIWTFLALGQDVGTVPGRWVLRGAGGGYPAGAFLLFPWHERTRKAVLVADRAGEVVRWNVLNPEDRLDTLILDAVADSAGNVHLVYATGYNLDLLGTFPWLPGLTREAKIHSYFYGRMEAKDLQPINLGSLNSSNQPNEVHLLRSIAGAHQLGTRVPIAVDPVTSDVLLGHKWLVRGDKWIEVSQSSPFFEHPGPVQVSTAGNGRFHAVTVGNIDQHFAGRSGIEYSMLSNGLWSSPVWLSIAGTLSLMGPTWVSMASTGGGNAFVVWSAADSFVGRWVQVNQ